MKNVKIVLAILAIVIIVLVLRCNYSKTTAVEEISLPQNQFTRRIVQEIESISEKSSCRFCQDDYDIAQYHIDDYASIIRLGSSLSDTLGNFRNKYYLSKRLYSAYVERFIAQADYVFNENKWSADDLKFILSESQRLRSIGRSNDYLDASSPVISDFNIFSDNIDSYNSEMEFIRQCRFFHYSNYDLESRFPIDRARSIIDDSKRHLSVLGIVRNSEVVTNGLNSVPEVVFSAHVDYLSKKLAEWRSMYMYYATLSAYKANLYEQLKKEVLQLDNPMYSGINTHSRKQKLLDKLETDYVYAIGYFKNGK